MDVKLKLDQILLAGRLDRSCVRYALQYPEHLPGMPKAGSPGRHRYYTLEQAMKLATCAHLQMAGITLQQAGEALKFLTKSLRRSGVAPHGFPPPERTDGKWILSIWDATYLTLDCGDERVVPAQAGPYHIPSRTIARVAKRPLAEYDLNLSLLRRELLWATLPNHLESRR